MQTLIRKLADNPYILPLLVISICIWRIFMPQLPVYNGLGWDGSNYYSLTVHGLQSRVLDTYLVFRIFPCLLIHSIFEILSIPYDAPGVILAFKIMATLLLGLSSFMVKWIFDQYKLSFAAQLTGFSLVYLNYAVLNFTFYYPVMTDISAFFLSIALFYFFIRGELTNVFLVGLIGAFTWPVLFPMALALILFPKTGNDFIPVKRSWGITTGILFFAYAAIVCWYGIVVNGEKADMAFTLPISQGMLPVSIFCTALMFFFVPFVLLNKKFLDLSYLRSQLTGNRIFAGVFLVITFILIRSSVNVTNTSKYANLYFLLISSVVHSLQRPFIAIVSHVNFFGAGILLLILFWRKLAAYISTFGLGVAGSVFINLFVFGVTSESRALAHFFPWMALFLALYLGQYRFSKMFYILIILLNFALSKLWLVFDFTMEHQRSLTDGTITFPNQWFFMHLGKWMTEEVWLWLCFVITISLLLFIISLYKIEFSKKEMLFYKKYEPVTYE